MRCLFSRNLQTTPKFPCKLSTGTEFMFEPHTSNYNLSLSDIMGRGLGGCNGINIDSQLISAFLR